ncbi:MAG: dephospho-CoA kinase [Verrucomicrobiota bacterium]
MVFIFDENRPALSKLRVALMKLYGITGGIGMGKSTSRSLLEQRGFPVIDTDDLAHQLVQPGQPALEEIKSAFNEETISADGQLNRRELARQVFSDPSALQKLEAILHPRIKQLWRAATLQWRERGEKLGFVIIPLLLETGAETEFDAVVCLACSGETQRHRLRERSWTEGEIDQRLAAQWPVEKKIVQSDFVIWTDTPLEIHARQLDAILS